MSADISKIIRKNANLIRHDGIAGALSVYFKLIGWKARNILLGGRDSYIEVKVNDYKMYVNLKDAGISRDLFVYGTREADQMYIMKNALRAGTNVLDVGANIGYYVIMESAIIGKNGRILAYEPSAENCALLKKNITLNGLSGRVEVNNEAVSNRAGISRFYLAEKSNLHTLNPIAYKDGGKQTAIRDFTEVKTADIYDVLKKHKDIGFIRMDIEGHEVEVLDGIARAVKDFKIYPSVLFETHFPKYDSTRHDIATSLKLLLGLGYSPRFIASSDERCSGFAEKNYKPRRLINTDRVVRGIYENIPKETAIDFISNLGGVRAVLLEKER